MRMFAGPNGSGKSELKTVLPEELLGIYLNPDTLERDLRHERVVDLARYNIRATTTELKEFFAHSSFLRGRSLSSIADRIVVEGDRLSDESDVSSPYLIPVLCDFMRRQWLARRITFTFETVMSGPDKPGFLREAQLAGYRTYLYFIATEDPEINVRRVRIRVSEGGHSVPEDRIIDRYRRSLENLIPAIRNSNRAYIFDNSIDGKAKTWIAEFEAGKDMITKVDPVPDWFKRYVYDWEGPRS